MNARELVSKLHWLGHDSFRLDGPPVIYFDPWKLSGHLPVADLVLVSHEHFDHCSPDDVLKISDSNTLVVANTSCAASLPGARLVKPGDRLTVRGVDIEVVSAYNLNKFRSPGQPFHPQKSGYAGYIITVGGVRLYHTGDTDGIPEMAKIKCDVALLPVSGIYVMTAEEAAEAAKVLGPQIAVPMHYGSGIGTAEDGARFAELYGGEVVLLRRE